MLVAARRSGRVPSGGRHLRELEVPQGPLRRPPRGVRRTLISSRRVRRHYVKTIPLWLMPAPPGTGQSGCGSRDAAATASILRSRANPALAGGAAAHPLPYPITRPTEVTER